MSPEGLLQARVAVVGHVEWVDFAVVPRLPQPGEILHVHEFWDEAAGGGAVAAVQMAKLTGSSLFLTALTGDRLGAGVDEQLAAQGVAVHAGAREGVQRRGFVYLDRRRRAHDHDPRRPARAARRRRRCRGMRSTASRGVYFTGGDAGALAAARRAGVIVATPRAGDALREAGVAVDVLVHSGKDTGEELDPGELDPAPRTVVTTLGSKGGRWDGEAGSGSWEPLPLPGPIVDEYGAGDSFAAGHHDRASPPGCRSPTRSSSARAAAWRT